MLGALFGLPLSTRRHAKPWPQGRGFCHLDWGVHCRLLMTLVGCDAFQVRIWVLIRPFNYSSYDWHDCTASKLYNPPDFSFWLARKQNSNSASKIAGAAALSANGVALR
jgi:hypothetical protein